MNKQDIVRQRAKAFGEGMAMGQKGGMIELPVLQWLIEAAYMKAFEDGIVFAQWGMFPSEAYTIETDADFYKEYTKEIFQN